MDPFRSESYYDRNRRRLQNAKEGTCRQRFKKFLYNKERHTCCQKTPIAWCKLFFYYFVFVAILIVILVAIIFSLNARDVIGDHPTNRKHVLINWISPGITVFSSDIDKSPAPIIWYVQKGDDSANNRRSSKYIDNIKTYLDEQDKLCEVQIRKNKFCGFNRTALGPCGTEQFGYDTNQPCVYIKLNMLYDWYPQLYKEIPKNFPASLRTVIEKKRQCLWINCEGNTVYDQEMLGDLIYYPEPAFHEDYFPPLSENHINPMVAVHLKNIKKGHIVRMTCRVYARNVLVKENSLTTVYIFIGQ